MTYKYKLSVCVCFKDEAKYVEDFIDHYIKQGVDHFYLISNNNSDSINEALNNSIYKPLITLFIDNNFFNHSNAYSPTEGLIYFYMKHCYDLVKKESEWIIVVDIDEFMFGKNEHTIKTYLDTIPDDVGSVYVLWNLMVPVKLSDNFSIKDKFKRINYDYVSNLSNSIKRSVDFGKTIVRTSAMSYIGLHKTLTNKKIINNYGENKNSYYDNMNKILYSENNYNKLNISLNHYYIRHQGDYLKRQIMMEKFKFINTTMLKGALEMLDLDEKYTVIDNNIHN